MNSIGMIFQQVQSTSAVTGKTGIDKGENNRLFQNLLDNSTSNSATGLLGEDAIQANSAERPVFNLEDLRERLMDDPELEAVLLEVLNQIPSNGENRLIEILGIDSLPNNLVNQLLQFSSTSASEAEDASRSDESSITIPSFLDIPLIINSFQGMRSVDLVIDFEQFESITNEANILISKLQNQEDVQKVAPKILELLQQWQSLLKKSGNVPVNEMSEWRTSTEKTGNGDQGVWKQLLDTFQKREQLAGKQLYNTDSKVTVTDVSKWLNKAIEASPTVNLNSFMPISKLEQYAIYIEQTGGAKSVDQQLIEQFQKIMNTSKLTTLPNGGNQLSIAIRPDNLGEMIIRLTQVNGEMTVKILVTSAAAKEMLESNIHQLKNMFSPHQVMIEKQELNVQTANTQKEQDNDQLRDQAQQQSNQSDQDRKQNSENSFEHQFEELLMNEKV